MNQDLVAVIDIGKTHAKLLLIDSQSGELVWSHESANVSLEADGLRQLDVTALERWLLKALAAAPRKHCISHLVPVAHGAAAVLLDSQGRVVAAPDYEDPVFEQADTAYRAQRDEFARTFSPLLPLGLNLGRQLHFLQNHRAALYERCAHILLYPQYWAWRLCGIMASEVTSLGCHTDLWYPTLGHYSDLAERAGWTARLPPLRAAREVLGPVSDEVRQRTGLDAHCQVICGIHDSNASYLCHLAGRSHQEPFALVSSGTWIVVLAQGVDLARLRSERDMLANVDAFGSPVATARFMGGREFAAIAGTRQPDAESGIGQLATVLSADAMALPSFASGGPFPRLKGRIINDAALTRAERAALATVYVALMCDLRLDDLGSRRDVLIDGPLAGNLLFGGILAALRPEFQVLLADRRTGITRGALYLSHPQISLPAKALRPEPIAHPLLSAYRARWRAAVVSADTASGRIQ